MSIRLLVSLLFIVTLWFPAATPVRAEALDFTAEHILEVPMDFRYLALPSAAKAEGRPWRLQLAAAKVKGERLQADLPMTSIAWRRPLKGGYDLNLLAFYDTYRFSGSPGNSVAELSFARVPSLPDTLAVFVGRVDGHASHFGFGASIARHYRSDWAWQAGLIIERLNVSRFRLEINSRFLLLPFSGTIDYAAKYDAITPFASLAWPQQQLTQNWRGRLEMIAALPLPRRGFAGRIRGNGVDAGGTTADVGRGTHIPDPYFGLRYQITHQPSGLSIDLGGMLYSYLGEPEVHRGIDRPLFLNLSWDF